MNSESGDRASWSDRDQWTSGQAIPLRYDNKENGDLISKLVH